MTERPSSIIGEKCRTLQQGSYPKQLNNYSVGRSFFPPPQGGIDAVFNVIWGIKLRGSKSTIDSVERQRHNHLNNSISRTNFIIFVRVSKIIRNWILLLLIWWLL